MKKMLLTLTAVLAVLTTSATTDGWNASFEPVSDAAELKGVHSTTAADGSVYVSSTYNKAFTFAGKEIADPEGLTSACIVKYNEKGEEQWAVTMAGNAVVYDIDADTDGTLYAAGNFMEKVTYTGANGESSEIGSEGVYSAFVAKISNAGAVEYVSVITPAVNAEIASKVGDPWGTGFESPLYTMWDPIYVTPNKIQVEGEKVYVSAKYMGDVERLGWKGSYIDMFGMMYSDNYSMGVFSLNKSDLKEATSIANVQMTGIVSDVQYYPEALNFVAENGTVYVGFIGFQKLTLTTAAGAQDFTFAASEDGGSLEHAFVLATINASTTTKTYNVAMHDKLAKPYNLYMDVAGDNLLIGGTFFGELPFDTQKTTGELASDIFVASVKKADGATNWAYVSGKESEATCMTQTGETVLISSTGNGYSLLNLTTGEATQSNEQTLTCADGTAPVYITETKVNINSIASTSSIGQIIAPVQPENGIIYNLAGQPVDKNYKGIVIQNGKKYIIK